jgi:thiol-disulfide isomerase/thioredoxin
MALSRNSRSRRSRKVNIFPFILIGGGVLLLVFVLAALLPGQGRAGGLVIPLLDGESVNLADYRGQVVAINFWASWCPPCRLEMPALDAYYRDHRDEGFVLIAVNSGETASTAHAFIQQAGYTFLVGLDENNLLTNQYGINGLPATLVFDASGELRYRHSGLITPEVLEAQITPLLSE